MKVNYGRQCQLYLLARLFRTKTYDLDIGSLNPKDQALQVGKVSMQFFNINLTNSRKNDDWL